MWINFFINSRPNGISIQRGCSCNVIPIIYVLVSYTLKHQTIRIIEISYMSKLPPVAVIKICIALWRHMAKKIWVYIGSGNGFLPDRYGSNPQNTWRNNNVVITSKRRHFHVVTSKWRRFDVLTTSLLRNVSTGRPLPEPTSTPHYWGPAAPENDFTVSAQAK